MSTRSMSRSRSGDGTGTTRRSGPDPTAGDRVRQDADPVELDEDRRVPQELEAQRPAQRQPLRAASG